MSGNFKISMDSSGVHAFINEELPIQDIEKILEFDESDIDNLLRTHAATQSYWEALAVRLKGKYEGFKNEWYKKWQAYSKIYAKYVLISYGDAKPTVDALDGMVTQIYSNEATDLEREKYAVAAFSVAEKRSFSGDFDEFKKGMYKYINSSGKWYFETVEATLNQMHENYKLVEVVANKLDARSYHMMALLKLMMAKKYNIGPQSLDEGQAMRDLSSRKVK